MESSGIAKVHHLNCCTNQFKGGRFFNERSPSRIVTHCLLLETASGLVLIDTGMGLDDMKTPSRLGPMHLLNRPRLNENETAIRQIQKMGLDPNDVRHIIMTHLDLDHTGGLPDFPKAKIHVFQQELKAATDPQSFKEKERYRKVHWAHGPVWIPYKAQFGEPWFGFEAIRRMDGLPSDIVLVRLPGHTRGHCGVAIEMSDGWLLHAGDAYYFHKQLNENPKTPILVYLFERLAHIDHKTAMRTKNRLRELTLKNKNVKVICSHDTDDFERLSHTRVP